MLISCYFHPSSLASLCLPVGGRPSSIHLACLWKKQRNHVSLARAQVGPGDCRGSRHPEQELSNGISFFWLPRAEYKKNAQNKDLGIRRAPCGVTKRG